MSTEETADPRPPRHRRLRRVVGGVGLAVGVGVAVVVGSYLTRDRPEARSIDEVVDRFHDSTTTSLGTTVPFDRPVNGVYTATGTGRESLSVPPNSQDDGATMPISVQPGANGCWVWRIDYNTAHWHEYQYCPDGAQLLLVGQRNYQYFDFGVGSVTNLAEFTCDPPPPIVVRDPDEGDEFAFRCTGTNSGVEGEAVIEGTAVVKGMEDLRIGGERVAAVRQVRDSQFTGAQKGYVNEVWWLESETGLPLRVERHIRVETDSVIGAIVYQEEGSWQLQSMTPKQ